MGSKIGKIIRCDNVKARKSMLESKIVKGEIDGSTHLSVGPYDSSEGISTSIELHLDDIGMIRAYHGGTIFHYADCTIQLFEYDGKTTELYIYNSSAKKRESAISELKKLFE